MGKVYVMTHQQTAAIRLLLTIHVFFECKNISEKLDRHILFFVFFESEICLYTSSHVFF